jgi:aryl-alcohol dehydrogenase-like predicted oxidoreductase
MTRARRGSTAADRLKPSSKSLKRLGTDYIDLYQIHFPERPMPWGSNPSRFDAECVRAGARRDTVRRAARRLRCNRQIRQDPPSRPLQRERLGHDERSSPRRMGTDRPRVQSIQNAYNLLNRTFETALGRDRHARAGRAARLFAAGAGLPDREISRRRPPGGQPHDAVRPRPALPDRRDRKRRSRPISRSLARSGSTPCRWRWPS